jgi:pyridoxal 5'-phosphate synthase pdxS subunit
VYAKEIRAPVELVRQTKHLGRLPVVNFAAGGVATPADAALMMQVSVSDDATSSRKGRRGSGGEGQ